MIPVWKNGHWVKDDQRISGRYMYNEGRGKYLVELDVEVLEDGVTTKSKRVFPLDSDTPEWDDWKLIREVNQIGG